MQADKGDQTGFDILLEKHLNGKNSMKDMIDFFRERQVIISLLRNIVMSDSCSGTSNKGHSERG